jgi:predicted adenine nucleotide alpha hydrolase (AANH) superfamily ATPase
MGSQAKTPPYHPFSFTGEENRVLLHSCCAPCSGSIVETLFMSGFNYTIYFYNPNIYPKQEYELRKAEIKRLADKYQVPFVDADYEPEKWFKRVEGLEKEIERGKRCSACFQMRLERAALYAHEHRFRIITSSLGISRWKDLEQVNQAATAAVSCYPDLVYWAYNWRKHGGIQRTIEISKKEGFYQQEYCGCVFSLRDANRKRREQGRNPIIIGANIQEESEG